MRLNYFYYYWSSKKYSIKCSKSQIPRKFSQQHLVSSFKLLIILLRPLDLYKRASIQQWIHLSIESQVLSVTGICISNAPTHLHKPHIHSVLLSLWLDFLKHILSKMMYAFQSTLMHVCLCQSYRWKKSRTMTMTFNEAKKKNHNAVVPYR